MRIANTSILRLSESHISYLGSRFMQSVSNQDEAVFHWES